MKGLAIVVVVVAASAGCHKKPAETTEPPVGSGSAGSGSAGSALATASPDAAPAVDGAPPPAATPSASAAALEDLDRAFAPIWKLQGAPRLLAACQHVQLLETKAEALAAAVPAGSGAPRWGDVAKSIAAHADDFQRYCQTQVPAAARTDLAQLAKLSDAFDEEEATPLHDSIGKAIALVPDAAPIDKHAGDPMPAPDGGGAGSAADGSAAAGSASGSSLDRLRAELKALDAAITTATTTANAAKTTKDACGGVPKIVELAQKLNEADVAAGPPKTAAWADERGELQMLLDSITSNTCADGSTSTGVEVAKRLGHAHDDVATMIKQAGS